MSRLRTLVLSLAPFPQMNSCESSNKNFAFSSRVQTTLQFLEKKSININIMGAALSRYMFTNFSKRCHVVAGVITPSLSRDGGTARTAIQVYAVNLIEIRLWERWLPILNQS